MRLSQYFLPTLKENPADAAIASHQYMLRAGMIRQSASGIYTWLPLGLRVLRKIEDIVREEQNRAGAQEILMPTIQSADLWRKSGRYEDYGKEMLRITDRKGADLLYGPTNEECITEIVGNEIKSYKDLPKNLYHIQWKFRDEVRPRFGVMRGREFLMKDAYSFDISAEAAVDSYNAMFVAYLRTFARLGLRAIPMQADTGPIGGELSHEFLVIAETGESEVFFHKDFEKLDPSVAANTAEERQTIVDTWTSMYAATDEIHDAEKCDLAAEDMVQGRGIEVGHIFFFGDKYSKPMGASVQGADGKMHNLQMGSYGVGVSRLVGGIIEASHDDKGIIWPESVAPYKVGLLNLGGKNDDCIAFCDDLYAKMQAAGIEVLYDDTKDGAGAKFSKMDLIGLPYQVAIGPRGLASGMVEVKNRKTGEKTDQTPEDFLKSLK